MHQTKKGNQWHFGMKARICVDNASRLVHHVHCTVANVADVTQAHRLLHAEEDAVLCGDSGYTGADKREELPQIDAGFLMAARPSQVGAIKNRKEHGVVADGDRQAASQCGISVSGDQRAM